MALLETQGRTDLVAWFKHSGWSQDRLAQAVGTTQANVSAWVRGIQRPGDEFREALEIITGVARHAWRTASEQAKVDHAREFVAATGTEG